MKIFASAIACNPYLGSENYVGWAAVQCLARDHDLWVATSKRHREDLEKAEALRLIPKNVRFITIGNYEVWRPSHRFGRLQDWNEYANFSKAVLAVARDLHQTVRFDLVHHITIATWRIPSPLWRLGIPFVFGPVGGYTNCPLRFLSTLSPASARFELLRTASSLVSRCSPSFRACVRNASHIFTPDAETGALMVRVRGSNRGVSSLCQAFYSEATIQTFARHGQARQPDGPLRILAGGNLIGTKGVSLALSALARVKKAGVKFRYRLGSDGPELGHLKRLAARLDLGDDVLFAESLRGEDYRRELGGTHVFLLPSLRESAGLTMMEAMLSGCVPIVADCGGPGVIVTKDCGYKIPVINPEQMVNQIAEAIITIDRDRKIILEKGRAATRRIATGFSEENYRQTINAVYRSVIPRAAG
jgi:glycosyltransferase involved in cell wall biosynthesis